MPRTSGTLVSKSGEEDWGRQAELLGPKWEEIGMHHGGRNGGNMGGKNEEDQRVKRSQGKVKTLSSVYL